MDAAMDPDYAIPLCRAGLACRSGCRNRFAVLPTPRWRWRRGSFHC